MSELINECPYCGDYLKATCTVIVTYTIEDDGNGGQDWDRHSDSDAIDDDTSEVEYITCAGCGREWPKDAIKLDEEGMLIGLQGPGGIAGERMDMGDDEDEEEEDE